MVYPLRPVPYIGVVWYLGSYGVGFAYCRFGDGALEGGEAVVAPGEFEAFSGVAFVAFFSLYPLGALRAGVAGVSFCTGGSRGSFGYGEVEYRGVLVSGVGYGGLLTFVEGGYCADGYGGCIAGVAFVSFVAARYGEVEYRVARGAAVYDGGLRARLSRGYYADCYRRGVAFVSLVPFVAFGSEEGPYAAVGYGVVGCRGFVPYVEPP